MFKTLMMSGCLLLALLSPATAQVYKWVDEKGVTHYGPRPPQGRKAQAIDNKVANPPPPGNASSKPPTWQEQESDFQGRRIQAEQVEAKRQAQDDRQRKACLEARDDLARMKASQLTYKLNDKGERVFGSDKDREASIARQEQLIATRC